MCGGDGLKKILLAGFTFLLLIPLAASCSGTARPLEVDESTNEVLSDQQAMNPVAMNNQIGFDFELFRSAVYGDKGANVVLSPASARMALAMAYNGASGEAKAAMAKVLQLEGLSLDEVDKTFHDTIASLENADPQVELQIANSLWGNNIDFNADFLARCRDNFDAEANKLDFADPGSADEINRWVSDNTKGKIGKIVDSLSPSDLFILLNAVYFNGKWQNAFDKTATSDEDFHLQDGVLEKVAMMKQQGKFPYFENEDFQAIRLPYGEGRLGMSILLPREGKDLTSLIDELTTANWSQWTTSMQEREGQISLPRFKVEYQKTLTEGLISMGMGPAFQGDAFDGMAAVQPLFLDDVIQKTYIDVNEEGTEAAAATGAFVTTAYNPEQPFEMKVDRPFLFAITDSATQTVLFLGSIVSP